MNLGNATGHPESFVMSNSFKNQTIAQIELFTKTEDYVDEDGKRRSRPSQAPRREGRPRPPRGARCGPHGADQSRPSTSASTWRVRTSRSTTATEFCSPVFAIGMPRARPGARYTPVGGRPTACSRRSSDVLSNRVAGPTPGSSGLGGEDRCAGTGGCHERLPSRTEPPRPAIGDQAVIVVQVGPSIDRHGQVRLGEQEPSAQARRWIQRTAGQCRVARIVEDHLPRGWGATLP